MKSMDNDKMKYPTLKRFMELNNYMDKVKALKLLKQIKKNFKEGKTISLPVK